MDGNVFDGDVFELKLNLNFEERGVEASNVKLDFRSGLR